MMKNNRIAIFMVLLTLGMLGCKTGEKATKNGRTPSKTEPTTDKKKKSELSETQKLLMSTRSQLSDSYVEHQDIPNFLVSSTQTSYANDGVVRGYRIQLISTRDRQTADSTAENFRQRSDSTWANQVIKTYLVFKQPFYKVRVGDFQRETLANRFLKTVKASYPGAWVVHDDININPSATDSSRNNTVLTH